MRTSFVTRQAAWLLLAAPVWAAACAPARDAPRDSVSDKASAAAGQNPNEAGAQAEATARIGTVPGFGRSAAPSRLEQARGGDGGIASDTRLGGVVSGNSATNVVTGANTIQASSFAGATGIPIVIQNTGANVLIQNATVINLQLK